MQKPYLQAFYEEIGDTGRTVNLEATISCKRRKIRANGMRYFLLKVLDIGCGNVVFTKILTLFQ